MKKIFLFTLIFCSLNLFANNATINVSPKKLSDWKVDKLLFGSFQEEHWGDTTPGIYEQYLVNPSFEKWKWDVKHFKTRIVFFEVPEDEDVAYPWEKAFTSRGISYKLSKENPKNSKLCQHIVVTSGKKAGIKQQLALPDYRTLTYRYKFYVRKKGNVKIKVEFINSQSRKWWRNLGLGNKIQVLDSQTVSGITNSWKEVEGIITLDKKLVDRHKNRYGVGQFVITVEGDGEVWIDQATLFPTDCVEGIFNPETIAYLKEYKISMIRWPGGNYTSGYHWKDGIGPVDKRPARWNPAN